MPAVIEPKYVVDAVELVVKLKATGTGEQKLDVARRVLETAHEAGREATVDEVLQALADSGVVHQATYDKALAIALHGEWVPPKETTVVPIEERLRKSPAAQATTPAATPVPKGKSN